MNSTQRQIDNEIYTKGLSLGLSDLQSRIIAGRIGGGDGMLVEQVISPEISKIPPPSLMKDMDKSAERLADAVVNGELIAVSTDFDTDGCSSCAIIKVALTRYFKVPEQNVVVHVSDRMKHGYGLSQGAIDAILSACWDRPPTLIITADHGSSDEDGISYYQKKMAEAGSIGDVVVTDHHEIPEEGPPISAYAVCNPKRADCTYPEHTVCGGVVAYFLVARTAQILIERGWIERSPHSILLSYAGLATIGDMMDMRTNTNRAIVHFALRKMNDGALPAWQVVKQLVDPSASVTAETLGFFVSPAINSASRMGYDGMNAVNFLTAITPEVAQSKFQVISESNLERQDVESALLEEAFEKAQVQINEGRRSLVIYLEEGHAGVNGIVCSRVKDRFNRPSAVLSTVGNLVVGSCRSLPGFDFRAGMSRVFSEHKGIAVKFGGHSQAAGLSIHKERVDDFVRLFEEINAPFITDEVISGRQYYDGVLFEDVPVFHQTITEIEALEPYGQKFEPPVFLLKGTISKLRVVGSKKNHAQVGIKSTTGGEISGMWFKIISSEGEELPVSIGDYIELLVSVGFNRFRGATTIQFIVQGVA